MTLPKGIRFLAGRIRWEVCYKGKRAYGTANTVEEAVSEREQAQQALRTGNKELMPKRFVPPPSPVSKKPIHEKILSQQLDSNSTDTEACLHHSIRDGAVYFEDRVVNRQKSAHYTNKYNSRS